MKIRIIKGTKQIGGCVTEISTDNTKIIIDFGEELDDNAPKLELEGLTYGKKKYDAVFITHSHGDHIGLINDINPDIPVYVEEKSLLIHNITCDFKNQERPSRPINTFKLDGGQIRVGDIFITPYIVDHSAYNACMFLIEALGKRVLHTGDLRRHGKKGILLKQALKEIGSVDALITEGTTLSRNSFKAPSEQALEKRATALFKEYDQVFVMQSSTNIDRTTSFVRSALKSNKNFVLDLFSAVLIRNLNLNVCIDNKRVFVWEPLKYQYKDDEFKNKYMQTEYNCHFLPNFVMQVKSSMLPDIKKLYRKGFIKKACLVYSMWEGYLEQDDYKRFVEELEHMGIKIIKLHTSGHADIPTLQMIESLVNPSKTIVIHTGNKEKGKEIFKKYYDLKDDENLII